ncbi:hypothetical protein SDJN02_13317, partial [Cucurbita argyrosperma subsp. argyrosperma]
MDSRAISAALLLSFLLFSAASAFNITNLLSQFPDFNDLNNFLTQTNLAAVLNQSLSSPSDNGAVSGLSESIGTSREEFLSVHSLSSDNTTVLPNSCFRQLRRCQESARYLSRLRRLPWRDRLRIRRKRISVRSRLCEIRRRTAVQHLCSSRSHLRFRFLEIMPSHSPRHSPSSPPPSSFSPVGSPKKAPAPSAKTPSKARAPPAKKPKVVADSPARSPPKSADGEDDVAAPAPSEKSGASRGSFIGAAAVMAVISVFLAL